jgi:hypothetical protein
MFWPKIPLRVLMEVFLVEQAQREGNNKTESEQVRGAVVDEIVG